MECTQKPTTHEMLELNELIRIEAVEVQKLKASLPMIADTELRSALETSLQTGQAHLKGLTELCRSAGLVH